MGLMIDGLRVYINVIETMIEITKENPEMHNICDARIIELEKYLFNFYSKMKENDS
jgi:hypothetical protein